MSGERRKAEQNAFARLSAGEPGAREALVERHLPLVRHVARRYAGGQEPLEDLVQVGCIGLLNAIDRFDPASGSAFSSFAVPTIMGEIRRHFRDRTWSVRVPRSLKELAAAARDAEEAFELREGRAPTAAELAGVLGTDVERLLEARMASAAQYPDSLDRPVRFDESGAVTLLEQIGDDDSLLAETVATVSLEMLMSGLDARDRELLRLRFEEDLTQSDIATRVGLSQMHVSRLLRDALAHVAGRLDPADGIDRAA
jgi:RNA polymerase sigma-B factor